MREPQRYVLAAAIAAIVVLYPGAVTAQVRPVVRPPGAQPVNLRGVADVGGLIFTATDSFEAILGSPTGSVFGVGGGVVLRQGIFAGVRLSWFQQTGERAFVFEGETFGLGIETTVKVAPIEVTGGYRFRDPGRRLIPYVGAGLGWHRYEETSEFAAAGENVSETHRGFHLLGGADIRLARWVRIGGEVQWTTVPDALGEDANSVAAAFDEHDLGGTAVRVTFVIGR